MAGSSAVTLSSGTPTISWNPSFFHACTDRPANSESDLMKPSSRKTGANRGLAVLVAELVAECGTDDERDQFLCLSAALAAKGCVGGELAAMLRRRGRP